MMSNGSDSEVLVGSFNAHTGKLSSSEACLSGCCALSAQRGNNGTSLVLWTQTVTSVWYKFLKQL